MPEQNKKPFQIIFVCTGNICRSPIAEGILKKLLPEDVRRKCIIESAGINAIDGLSVTPFARTVAEEDGVEISNHKSRSVKSYIVKKADLIFAMTPEHMNYFRRNYPQYMDKVFLLKRFDIPDAPKDAAIHDPISGTLEMYRACYLETKLEIIRILNTLIRLIKEYNSS